LASQRLTSPPQQETGTHERKEKKREKGGKEERKNGDNKTQKKIREEKGKKKISVWVSLDNASRWSVGHFAQQLGENIRELVLSWDPAELSFSLM
jgi:hypothetical protein